MLWVFGVSCVTMGIIVWCMCFVSLLRANCLCTAVNVLWVGCYLLCICVVCIMWGVYVVGRLSAYGSVGGTYLVGFVSVVGRLSVGCGLFAAVRMRSACREHVGAWGSSSRQAGRQAG